MKKSTTHEIERITSTIPQKLKDTLYMEQPIGLDSKEIMTRALKDDEVSEEDKSKFRNILDSGYFDKMTEKVTNPKVERKIEEYLSKEIDKAVKAGRLPDPRTSKELSAYRKKAKKWTTKHTQKPS